MASESLDVAASVNPTTGEWVHSSSIIMEGMCLDLAIGDGAVGPDTMREYSGVMAGWAKAILSVARARGDNDSDQPGTFEEAIAAAEFFLHLSQELAAAAPKMIRGA